MELWKEMRHLENVANNRDGKWMEILRRKHAQDTLQPAPAMTQEEWRELYGDTLEPTTATQGCLNEPPWD